MISTALDSVEVVTPVLVVFPDALVEGSRHISDRQDQLLGRLLIRSGELRDKLHDILQELEPCQSVTRVEEILLDDTLECLPCNVSLLEAHNDGRGTDLPNFLDFLLV